MTIEPYNRDFTTTHTGRPLSFTHNLDCKDFYYTIDVPEGSVVADGYIELYKVYDESTLVARINLESIINTHAQRINVWSQNRRGMSAVYAQVADVSSDITAVQAGPVMQVPYETDYNVQYEKIKISASKLFPEGLKSTVKNFIVKS